MKRFLVPAVLLIALSVLAVGMLAGFGNHPKPATTTDRPTYFALGDSVAAGIGLSTDSDSSACNRTNESYPHQAAALLGMNLTNLACSGATVRVGLTGSQEVNGLSVGSQLDRLPAQPLPALVTLTVGANDAEWTRTLASCYSGECGLTSQEAAITAKLANLRITLSDALKRIAAKYPSDKTKLVVTGYYQVFPSPGTPACADISGIDGMELIWGRLQQTRLSDAVAAAVKDAGFGRYVVVDFSGHELCTPDPWVQGLGDKEPYHPTATGQARIAQLVRAAYEAKP